MAAVNELDEFNCEDILLGTIRSRLCNYFVELLGFTIGYKGKNWKENIAETELPRVFGLIWSDPPCLYPAAVR